MKHVADRTFIYPRGTYGDFVKRHNSCMMAFYEWLDGRIAPGHMTHITTKRIVVDATSITIIVRGYDRDIQGEQDAARRLGRTQKDAVC